jgi:hypothetical protein
LVTEPGKLTKMVKAAAAHGVIQPRQHIDVQSTAGIVPRDRAEQRQRDDSGIAEFRLVGSQSGNGFISPHGRTLAASRR